MSTALQHWLDRNRPPRVQITYDVEKLGASAKLEIPFIVGIIGDFAGGKRPHTPIGGRDFVQIDRDNFGQVMEGIAPALQLTTRPQYTVARTPEATEVKPSAGSKQSFAPALAFTEMADFEPRAIIDHVTQLAEVKQTRQTLSDLLAKLGTDPTLEKTLWTTAGTPARTCAVTNLAAADKALTGTGTGADAVKGARELFNAAVKAVLDVEKADPNKAAVDKEKTAVDAAVDPAVKAVDTSPTGYTALHKAADTGATAAQVRTACDAAWTVALALRAGMATLAEITRRYTPGTGENDPKKLAQKSVADAQPVVDDFIAKAGQAARSGASAVAVAPASA
jgi:type VI secretion system protein ImpB